MGTKYTFDNWWNGDVILEYATIYHHKNETPLLVGWGDFNNSDVERIKNNQENLFNEKVNSILTQHIEQFEDRYSRSKLKEVFHKQELNECLNILKGLFESQKFIHFEHWNISFEQQYLDDIQQYFKEVILKGKDIGFDFIHSPQSNFQNHSQTDSRIYARFVWEYYQWLKEFNTIENKKKTIDEKTKNKVWFQVGLKFANGEIYKLVQKYESYQGPYYSKIERDIGIKNSRQYISASLLESKDNSKNIFGYSDKIELIIEYCKLYNIQIHESFNKRINSKK